MQDVIIPWRQGYHYFNFHSIHSMKLLHTSDWHLGRALYGRKRVDEFDKFLNWLAELIQEEQVDLLCIAGDIFDSTNPSNKAQNLYYGFLQKIIAQGCSHVIITAGNHDSPTLLEAPKDLLKAINVHVIGNVTENLEDEIILLRDAGGKPKLMVCAVPYLRDRDIRTAREGETIDDKGHNLIDGIGQHYRQVIQLAQRQRSLLKNSIPLVAMGHLFTAGGSTVEGDGVRDLYIGSLVHVDAEIFSKEIDYLALGHLHRPQKVSASVTRRYSGSPLPMSFSEAGSEKQVVLVDFDHTSVKAIPIPVPCFQKLVSLQGDLISLLEQIEQLKNQSESIWIEIIYQGNEPAGNLQVDIHHAVRDSKLEVLRIVNSRIVNSVLKQNNAIEALEDLSIQEVFDRCLLQNDIPEELRKDLIQRFQEALRTLHEKDANAE